VGPGRDEGGRTLPRASSAAQGPERWVGVVGGGMERRWVR